MNSAIREYDAIVLVPTVAPVITFSLKRFVLAVIVNIKDNAVAEDDSARNNPLNIL